MKNNRTETRPKRAAPRDRQCGTNSSPYGTSVWDTGFWTHGQVLEAIGSHQLIEASDGCGRFCGLAKAMLGGNLPGTGSTDEDLLQA